MIGPDLLVDTGVVRAMNSDGPDADRGEGYAYRRRYLDEDVWEPVDVHTVCRVLGEAYRDTSLALDFLCQAGSIRTPAAVFEAQAT